MKLFIVEKDHFGIFDRFIEREAIALSLCLFTAIQRQTTVLQRKEPKQRSRVYSQ